MSQHLGRLRHELVSSGTAAGALFFVVLLLVAGVHPSAMNNYVRLADAWLHLTNSIGPHGAYIDALSYHGHDYVIEAPMPAVLMLPLVMLDGLDANQTLVCAIVAAFGVAGVYRLALRLTGSDLSAAPLSAFAAFGTSLFACAADGAVWYFALVSGFAFSVLALDEMLGKRRGWLVAIWACAAGFSHYSVLPVAVVYLVWLAIERRFWSVGAFATTALICATPWMVYNEARWGLLYDPGYTLFYHLVDWHSHGVLSPFLLENLPAQLQLLFVTPPHPSAHFPWIVPPKLGFAITWLSFPLIGAFLPLARVRTDPRVALLWIAALLAAAPTLFYYDTGDVQFGARHALDFEPFLVALLAFALQTRFANPLRVLLWASAALGLYEGAWYLRTPDVPF